MTEKNRRLDRSDRISSIPRKPLPHRNNQDSIGSSQASHQILPGPMFIPTPPPVYDSCGSVNIVETNLARLNTDNFNIEILTYHRFLLNNSIKSKDDYTIFKWDLQRELSIPPYPSHLQEVGLSRERFEEICHLLRRVHDKRGRKFSRWLRIFRGISLEKYRMRERDNIAASISPINQELNELRIPVVFSYRGYWQSQPIRHEIILTKRLL
jgi:hypothetical protein